MADAAQTTVGAMTDNSDELSCVLIPVYGEQLLLPNVCVAEIVPWRRFKVLDEGPAWCMGFVGWRGHKVPVLHFAGFGQEGEPWRHSARCLVVMNRSRNPAAPAFYAFAAEGLPRMMQLLSDDLEKLGEPQGEAPGPADAMRVNVGTEPATIPNLDFVEDRLCEYLKQA